MASTRKASYSARVKPAVLDELQVGLGAVEDPRHRGELVVERRRPSDEGDAVGDLPRGGPARARRASRRPPRRRWPPRRAPATRRPRGLGSWPSWRRRGRCARRAVPSPRARYSGRSLSGIGLGVAHDGGVDRPRAAGPSWSRSPCRSSRPTRPPRSAMSASVVPAQPVAREALHGGVDHRVPRLRGLEGAPGRVVGALGGVGAMGVDNTDRSDLLQPTSNPIQSDPSERPIRCSSSCPPRPTPWPPTPSSSPRWRSTRRRRRLLRQQPGDPRRRAGRRRHRRAPSPATPGWPPSAPSSSPADVRWVFISHDDHDHIGNLLELLDLCPQATLVGELVDDRSPDRRPRAPAAPDAVARPGRGLRRR